MVFLSWGVEGNEKEVRTEKEDVVNSKEEDIRRNSLAIKFHIFNIVYEQEKCMYLQGFDKFYGKDTYKCCSQQSIN